MNPNMEFEDEYIENLLKQIHFMNMECKLLKEKQKEGKGYLTYEAFVRTIEDDLLGAEEACDVAVAPGSGVVGHRHTRRLHLGISSGCTTTSTT